MSQLTAFIVLFNILLIRFFAPILPFTKPFQAAMARSAA